MAKFFDTITGLIYRITASKKFFVGVLGLFVFQASWLAFTAIYPLPFDEYAHVGAIQLYAEQWSWIVTSQSLDSGIIGDLTREPSFLYRWLMSFPFRILDTFLGFDQVVIAMRLMNIAMVAGGIVLFRKLLLEWGISRRVTHVVLLAFVMTPIVPFLAAHVNYDNAMFLLAPIVFLYATRLLRSNNDMARNLMLFVLTGVSAVLVKQTFLPLFLIAFAYVMFSVWRRNSGHLIKTLLVSWEKLPKTLLTMLIVAGLFAVFVLGAERYGGNIMMYRTSMPKCQQLHPVELCDDFGPWYRNNVVNVQNRPAEPPYGNLASFSQYWVSRMMRGYFVPFQHTPTKVVWEKEPYGPIVVRPLLPLQINAAVAVAVVGALAIASKRRKLWQDPYLRFALVLCAGFLVTQWLYNYAGYLSQWKAEAVQARYTFPILILIFTLIGWAINQTVASRQAKALLVVLLCLFYVWGGGIAGWLIRADDTWRWQNPVVQQTNHYVQNILRHIVIH